MSPTEAAFESLVVSVETARAWTQWLATGDPDGIPDTLTKMNLVQVNGPTTTDLPLPSGPVHIALRRRFAHPDGTRWDHTVGQVADNAAYAQQLTSPHRSARGTLAVAHSGTLYVWLNADGAGDPPAPIGQIYLSLLRADDSDLRR